MATIAASALRCDASVLGRALALGALADEVGIPIALGVNAALLTISGGVFHFTAREIRRKAQTAAAKIS